MPRSLGVLVAALLAVTLAPATPASAAPTLASGVGQTVIYNDPLGTSTQRHAVIDRLERAFDLAPAGSVGRVVTWRIDREQTTDKALAAVRRGVDLRIALTGHSWEKPATQRLARELQAMGQGHRLVKCSSSTYDNGSCLGTRAGATEHVKAATWSALTDGRRNVVQISSSNYSNGQVGTYNDVLELSGDADCYGKVKGYIDDALAKRRDGAYRQNRGTFSCPGSLLDVKAGPSDASTKPDDFQRLLRTFTGRAGCKVYVPSSHFRDVRLKVAHELARLKREGAYVSVLARIPTDGSGNDVRAVLSGAGIPFRSTSPHQHLKGLTVKGCYRRGTTTPADGVSVHGSEHLVGDVWRNNEMMVVTRHPATVDTAARWFEQNAAR